MNRSDFSEPDLRDRICDEIASAIQSRDGLTLMFGAGVSMFRRSGCPGWQAMVKELIKAIVGDAVARPLRIIKPHLGLLFNEAFLQLMLRTLEGPATFQAIEACLDAPFASKIHRFAAWSAANFNVSLLTTNFDELIERSGVPGSPRQIVKLHGTLSSPETLRFTANSIFTPLSDELTEQSRNLLRRRTLVVAGYGGMDQFDVMPVLFEKGLAKRVIWVFFPGQPPERSARSFFESVPTEAVGANIDEILSAVYRKLARESQLRDAELDTWGQQAETCPAPNWWRKNVKRWNIDLRQVAEPRLKLLWARLADHLRLYRVIVDGEERNIADDAYEAVRGLREPSLELEARARSAYMGRTMGESRRASLDLARVIRDIRKQLRGAPSKELRRLLGWAMHQRGIALQNEGRHRAADIELRAAIDFRKRTRDPALPFSEFQSFMNARRAFDKQQALSSEFYDSTWQRRLAKKLDRAARRFKREYEIADFAQTLHNAAFVYQAMAEEAARQGRHFKRINHLIKESLSRYQEARGIREKLRDPRMIAQSEIRLAQLELHRACVIQQSDDCLDLRLADAEAAVSNAESLARSVRRSYKRLPQEKFRLDDVEHVIEDVRRFRQVRFNSKYRHWFPESPVRRRADFDASACLIRDDPKRGWPLAVVVAVFDAKLKRILMVQLGKYAKSTFGGNPWMLPGGRVELSESPSAAAVRELSEETGVEIRRNQLCPAGWFPRPNFTPHDSSRKGELLLLFAAKLKSPPRSTNNPPEIMESAFHTFNLSEMLSIPSRGTGRHPLQPLPDRHVYWARVAQACLSVEGRFPLFFVYRTGTEESKPWLNCERSTYEFDRRKSRSKRTGR